MGGYACGVRAVITEALGWVTRGGWGSVGLGWIEEGREVGREGGKEVELW